MKIFAKKLAVSLLLPLLAGGLAAVLIRDGVASFASLPQPPLSPPPALFPIVWTILYVLMGVAAYLVWSLPTPPRAALTVCLVQLAFNFIWPLLFFNAQAFGVSLLWLFALWALVLSTVLLFFHASKAAGFLLLPYFVWCTFALLLNYGVWMLNR